MRLLSMVAVVAMSATAAAEGWPKVTYRGKVRSVEWLDRVYAAFRPKLAVVDGVVCDTQRSIDYTSNPKPGIVARIQGPIVSVVDGKAAIVRLSRKATNIIGEKPTKPGTVRAYVRFAEGVPKARAIDRLVAILRTRDVSGEPMIECLELPRQFEASVPTKAQFAAAVNGGLPLVVHENKRTVFPTAEGGRITMHRWKSRPLQ